MKSKTAHSITEETRLKAIILTKGFEVVKAELEYFNQGPML